MGRRLEKYLFCNTAFFSLFSIKFVRYVYTTKYALSWNKKSLQNISEIFDMVHMNQVGNLTEGITWLLWHNLVSKYKGNRKHVNDVLLLWKLWQTWHCWHACSYLRVQDFRFPAICFAREICHKSHARSLLDFRLGSYEPYRKFPTYFVGVFCSHLECKLPIYIGNLRFILLAFLFPA